ncbi:Pre-mRNA-splicing factor CWC24 [Yarrowia sp. C11]|nr:Pre-mRNA-splicing factor CWC24 [Yarrowia sp. E02]KAG5365164.1 Pre-mRNA-splicing factor CWC24 [Yarrowia sp. C11]
MFKRKKNSGQKRSVVIDSDSPSSGSEDESAFSPAFKRHKKGLKSGATNTASSQSVSAPDFSSKIDHSHSQTLTKSEEATKETILYARDESDDSDSFSKGPYKVPFSKPTTVGLKASSNIKSTTSQDYQPDVCKDYKLTGFCGYGDSCKFLHMREDYKAGWQVEREWEIESRDKSRGKESGDSAVDGAESESVSLECPVCKKEYTKPVVTQCGHVFCEACFLSKHKKKQSCFVCGKNTKGVAKPYKG